MYKVDHAPSYAQIVYPENPLKEPLAVTEIGQALQPAGFAAETARSNNYILQCVISGSCTYNNTFVNAPALIYVAPGSQIKYHVNESCNDFCLFWIKFGGEMAENVINSLGLGQLSEIITLKHPEKVKSVFSALVSDTDYNEVNDSLFMLSGLYRLLSIFSVSIPQKSAKNLSAYTQTILDYIHINYPSRICEKDMAAKTNLSINYMHKIFLSDMKTTPINYLNSYRIKRAKELLRDTDYSIAKVSTMVGISGGDYFCRVFRKYNGDVSPTSFRKRTRMKLIDNN